MQTQLGELQAQLGEMQTQLGELQTQLGELQTQGTIYRSGCRPQWRRPHRQRLTMTGHLGMHRLCKV